MNEEKDNAETKFCRKCFSIKSVHDFYQSKGVVNSWCKECSRKYQNERNRMNPKRAVERSIWWKENYSEKYAENRKNNRHKEYLGELKRKYGLTENEANRLIEVNEGACGICGAKFDRFIKRNLDHCHATGKVRDFLCRRCNSVLGLINDDVSLLGKFNLYIEKHKSHSS